MSQIDAVKAKLPANYFSHLTAHVSYVRLLDTPGVWGQNFNDTIMQDARSRTKQFRKAVEGIIQRTQYRCDVASLNSPDADWGKFILGAMDMALQDGAQNHTIQFRFLFGQTPLVIKDGPHPNLVNFKGQLVRFVRERQFAWRAIPDIWVATFARLQSGLIEGARTAFWEALPTGVSARFGGAEDGDGSKMTWNHAKIIAADGVEALVGGHNLNMDLFTSYPPVHDVSVAVHGEAAYGAQSYLNLMWACKSEMLLKEHLVNAAFTTVNDDNATSPRKPTDPLEEQEAKDRMRGYHRHDTVAQPPYVKPSRSGAASAMPAISNDDRQTLVDIAEDSPFKEKRLDPKADLQDYKTATRILSIGKYFKGAAGSDFESGSETMKEQLIKGASRILRLSQMDLVSAWKRQWRSHKVCHWILDALRQRRDLIIQVVVSPLDAGAGADGEQYSFGSGAARTYELMEYYMTHDLHDKQFDDHDQRLEAMKRLHIAPFYFTDQGLPANSTEGVNYKWPAPTPQGQTAPAKQPQTWSLRQPSLAEKPPKDGVIGSAFNAVLKAGGVKGKKVDSAPGNHAKLMIVDDQAYVVGSDNLYPGFLSEFNYLIEGADVVNELIGSYWRPLWRYSGAHCVNPHCRGGCQALHV